MSFMDNIDYGIIVCGYKFNDMVYTELYQELGSTFQMLLVASRAKLEEGIPDGVVSVEMPLKSYDLLNTLEMMAQALERIKKKESKSLKREMWRRKLL